MFEMTKSAEKAEHVMKQGAHPVIVDAFDAARIASQMNQIHAELVIHLLNDLPFGTRPEDMIEGTKRNARIRREGTRNLVEGAKDSGASKIIATSIAWIYVPGTEPHSEDDALDVGSRAPQYSNNGCTQPPNNGGGSACLSLCGEDPTIGGSNANGNSLAGLTGNLCNPGVCVTVIPPTPGQTCDGSQLALGSQWPVNSTGYDNEVVNIYALAAVNANSVAEIAGWYYVLGNATAYIQGNPAFKTFWTGLAESIPTVGPFVQNLDSGGIISVTSSQASQIINYFNSRSGAAGSCFSQGLR
ncbi:MAG: hypothetical protein JO322_01630 [Candidatus Eremiobacteraeota bacterium]|nr:hypothetical protein [Candidatus Eremiobacteraeota bacterium]